MRTTETMAAEFLGVYMKDYYINGKLIMKAWPADIAARKAAAAHPNFAREIYKIAEKLI